MRSRNFRRATPLALFTAGALLLGACGSDDDGDSDGDASTEIPESAGLSGDIQISGSSTVEPISVRVAELYAEKESDVNVTVKGPGTGDGFKVFCDGETDISDASRAIKDEEASTCEANGIEYVELQIAFDGISVITSPDNPVECLSFEDLYALVGPEAQDVTTWSQAGELAAELGSTTEFPEEDLDVTAPGAESGTYDSFIEIVLEGIGEARAEEGAISEDDAATTRTDYNASADDNAIITGISSSTGSLGWVGFAFAEENADVVKEIAISGEDGACVEPTVETIADGSYPVSRPLFIYVNKAKAADSEALTDFVDFYLNEAYTEAVTMAFGETGYVELPEDLLSETLAAWDGR